MSRDRINNRLNRLEAKLEASEARRQAALGRAVMSAPLSCLAGRSASEATPEERQILIKWLEDDISGRSERPGTWSMMRQEVAHLSD